MKTAMILAAGRGERLRPLTEKLPKALCKINNRPLIEHHIINLVRAGFTNIIINHAYLGGQIRQHLGDGRRFGAVISYSPEPPGGLETAGGIIRALPLLGKSPFLVVNADVYTDFDFTSVKNQEVTWMHLVLTPKKPLLHHVGDFGLMGDYLINTDTQYTFAGIALYHPRVFNNCLPYRHALAPLLRKHAGEHNATGVVYRGTWFDIGSIERLKAAHSATDFN